MSRHEKIAWKGLKLILTRELLVDEMAACSLLTMCSYTPLIAYIHPAYPSFPASSSPSPDLWITSLIIFLSIIVNAKQIQRNKKTILQMIPS